MSRFDGYQFTSYTTDQGLPHRRVSDLLETRKGTYWVATDSGVCRFNPIGSPLFEVFNPGRDEPSHQVEALVEDSDGQIWCATHAGIYQMEDAAGGPRFRFVDMGMPADGEGNFVQAIVLDRQGALWAATRGSGLYRRLPDGSIEHYTTRDGLAVNRVETLLEDRSGRLWAGTTRGLNELFAVPPAKRPTVERLFTTKDGLASDWIESLFESSDGTVWIGTDNGISQFIARTAERGRWFRNYTTANGLSSHYVMAMAEDREGNLWAGSDSGGAMKLVRGGLTTFTEADGLAAAGTDAIFEDRAGELCVISSGTKHYINRFDGRRFAAVWPDFPKQINNFGWGWNQVTFQDRTGEWWVPTGEGLCRFPFVRQVEQLAHTPPSSVYTTSNGLPFNDVFRLYEDSRGDIWISTISSATNGLSRWDRATQTIHTFAEAYGVVPGKKPAVASFCEDNAGNLWIGCWGRGLIRRSVNGFAPFSGADGLPAGTIRSIYMDHSHRLWIASSSGGLARIDDPAAARPQFVHYTTTEGLSSNDVWCVTEDQWGRIYIGTGRGLDRLDPETGHIKHYSTADGLMEGKVTSAFRDHSGALWFASNVHGLSRLIPLLDTPQTPPPILISGLRIAGEPYQLSQLGESEVPPLDLGSSQNQLNIDFVGLAFGSAELLRYQYKLEGADKDWGPPTDQRSVNYAHLAPGHYRFLVRAVNGEGLASVAPATISFTIPPPIWRRWWFLGLAALLLSFAFYAVHRQRVARLIELERVRTRIATDLHDDIGANLSLIAMLSEVAGSNLQTDAPRTKEWFSTIAATSRDTVDAMSDIVWAVNPKRDSLRDLIQRMRRFADDIFGTRDIQLLFRAVEPDRDLKLGADLRREVFLIFKEGINNIVRHSGCSIASLELQVDHGWLVLEMSDNGRGFDPDQASEGNGLASMQMRAQKLGGDLRVISIDRHGANITLRVPLGRGRF